MISKIKSINSFTKRIIVSIPWSDLEEPFTNHIKLFSKKINMPGFRKGKVPQKIILQNYKSELEADFAQSALDEYYALSLNRLISDLFFRKYLRRWFQLKPVYYYQLN